MSKRVVVDRYGGPEVLQVVEAEDQPPGVGEVAVRVGDDGVGPPAPDAPRGKGLDNLASRAARRGGRFSLEPRADGGTRAEWVVPLDEGDG